MSIAKMSGLHNSCRYITMAIDGYHDFCLNGTIFHAGKRYGIQFDNFLEMMFSINKIYDDLCYPKQTVTIRNFQYCKTPEVILKENESEKAIRKGKLATCRIQLKYRYNASWQGSLTWIDEPVAIEFKSFLHLIKLLNMKLRDGIDEKWESKDSSVCQLAVDSYERGAVTGWINKLTEDCRIEFTSIFEMALIMGNLTESEQDSESHNIISETYWEAFHRKGKKATFIVRILYREHQSWQGMIYWRERGEKAVFRSFFELLSLMVSALEYHEEEVQHHRHEIYYLQG